MQRIYYAVDTEGQLQRVAIESAEAFWEGRTTAEKLGVDCGDELRLVSVLIDENLDPVVIFFVRLDLDHGEITAESRLEAYEAATARGPRYASPAAQKQFVGWPEDWPRQMAVALDVPVKALNRIAIGGPLLMSDLWGVPVEKVVEYFETALGEDVA